MVAFRGSSSVRNYIADIDFPFTDASAICPGCAADMGFFNSYQEAKSGVLAAVKSAANANSGYEVIVTGHSLGGVISTFMAAELRNEGYTAGLVRLPFEVSRSDKKDKICPSTMG